MGNESGTWIMHGLPASDPGCIHTAEELTAYIDRVGFLPLFAGDIPGFSVEEHTQSAFWWSGDVARDPWEWREQLAGEGQVAYGKFFDKKAGFISLKWLPVFASYRRNGYDFDALWDDEMATFRQKKIMDVLEREPELLSNRLKEMAGFGKGGEKNFEGVLTDLQMRTYLCVRAFRRRINKKGEPYGWPLAVYTTPEHRWGKTKVTGAYDMTPEECFAEICGQMRVLYPGVTLQQLKKL